MMQISERLRDLLGFGVLLVLLAVLLIVPHEIPKEIQGDFPAEVYPRTLLVVGVVLLGLQLVVTLMRGRGSALTLESAQLARTAALLAVMWAGYAIILLVGFVLGGAFLVLSFAWLLRERNAAAAIVGLAAPLVIYLCLEHAFGIRLPSLFDLF